MAQPGIETSSRTSTSLVFGNISCFSKKKEKKRRKIFRTHVHTDTRTPIYTTQEYINNTKHEDTTPFCSAGIVYHARTAAESGSAHHGETMLVLHVVWMGSQQVAPAGHRTQCLHHHARILSRQVLPSASNSPHAQQIWPPCLCCRREVMKYTLAYMVLYLQARGLSSSSVLARSELCMSSVSSSSLSSFRRFPGMPPCAVGC